MPPQIVPTAFLHHDIDDRFPFFDVDLIKATVPAFRVSEFALDSGSVLPDREPRCEDRGYAVNLVGRLIEVSTTAIAVAVRATMVLLLFDCSFDGLQSR
jgi:hypothetical protein